MSKLGKFAAACAAVVLSVSAFGAGTADENGVVPYYWYTFNGAYTSIGANDLTFGGEAGNNSWVATDATSGHKALQLKSGAASPYGANLDRGSGDFTIVTVAKTADIESGVIWAQGGNSQAYSFALATDGGTRVYLRFFGSSWPEDVRNKTDALCVTKDDAATAYHVYTVSYDSTSKTWSLGVDLEQPMTVVADLNGFSSQNFQFGSVHGGMISGMAAGNGVCLYEYRLYQKLLTKSQLAKVVKTYAAEFTSIVVQDKHTLEVDGLPECCGEVSPGYGYTIGIPDGASFVCSAPSGDVDLGDGRFASCIGYTLYTNKLGTSDEWLPWMAGNSSSFTYTHPNTQAKLVWNWKVNAPLGVEKPTYVSSEFASSEIAANVTGIGKTAESATLTFHYGTTTACADGMVTVENVTNAGVWIGTLPNLFAGKTYYVKATLSNGKDTPVTTAVYDFVQPEVAEEGGEPSVPRGYVEMDSLTFDGNEYFMLPLRFLTADGFGFAMKANVSKRLADYGPHIVNFGRIDGSRFTSGTLWVVYRKNGLYFNVPVSEGPVDIAKDKDGNNIYPDAGIGHDIAIDFNVAGDGQNFINGAIPETSFTVATYCSSAIFIGSYGSAPGDDGCKLNGKVYYVRLYDHGTLKMNLVPCVKLGDTEAENVVGFYDTENPDPATAFVANLGTGKVTAGEPVPLVCPALELRDGQFVVTASASDTARTAVLCWGETYGGIGDWECMSEQPVTIPDGATTASFPKPEGWGKTVWFARVKIGEGADAIWSKTLVAEPSAPIGMNAQLSKASSEFGSSDIAATVTGIGKTAESATLTFNYGTTPACADGSVAVTVTDAGVWSGTLPNLFAGKTYYVKATLSNGKDTSVTTAVYDFVQPEVAEGGGEPSVPRGYVEMDSLTFDGNEYFMLPLRFSTADGFGFAMKANVSERLGGFGPHIVNFGRIDGSRFATDSGSLWAVYRPDGLFFGNGIVSGDHQNITKDKDGNNIYPDAGIGHDIAIDFNVAGDGQNFINGAIPETFFTVATYCQPAIFIGGYGNAPDDGGYRLSGKVYYVRLYDHGTLKMNLVPCVKLGATEAENVVGFYDTENLDPATAFVANLGTGKVTAGEPVPLVCPALELRDGQFVVTASASDTDRTAVLCWGETYGGIDDDDWACRSEQPVTIPAGATTASFPKPEGWGKTVWFARVKIVEGDDAIWSKTLVAEDANLPAVSLNEVDGLGGDTLVVKGTVDSLGGASCTLKVCTGTSEDAITEEWTNLDGDIRTDTGDFTFTLFESDTTASRYLKPGETYFVRVVATSANGKTAWSNVLPVKMAGKAAFKSQSATVSNRVMTVTASMADVGMLGKTMVELWVGEQGGTLVKVAGPVEVTAVVQNFTLTYELPKYETPYTWQLRASNSSVGGTVNPTTESEQKSQAAPDSATYTWTGAGADNKWRTAANWSDDKGGDCLGYPQTKNATAKFMPETTTTVEVDRDVTCGVLSMNDVGVNVTMTSESGRKLAVQNLRLFSGGKALDPTVKVFDGVKMSAPASQVFVGNGSRVILRNGAELECKDYCMAFDGSVFNGCVGTNLTVVGAGCKLKVEALAKLASETTCVVSNGTLEVGGNLVFNCATDGGTLRIEGDHPLVRVAKDVQSTNEPRMLTGSGGIVFDIPEGGYQSVPIVLQSATSSFGGTDAQACVPLHINVVRKSGAYRNPKTTVYPLLSTAGSINTARQTFGELRRPQTSAFVYAEAGDTTMWQMRDELLPTATPTLFGVRIGAAHGLAIFVR